MGDGVLQDEMILDGLWCAMNNYHMGITAENIAEKYGITREEQDQIGYETIKGDASTGWLRLGSLVLALAALAAVLINRRLPG